MFKTGNYKIGFDIWGLTLFLAIMLPNFIWFAVPAVNDVLRNKSVTPLVDMIASVFQAVMVVALCVIVNKYCQKPMKKGNSSAFNVIKLNVKMRRKQVEKIKHNEIWVD